MAGGTKFGRNAGGAGPAQAPKGRFAGVAPAGNKYPHLPYGRHLIEVNETRRATTRGDTFIADVTILESNAAGVSEGSQFSWVQSMKDTFDVGASKVMRFVIACGNCDDQEVEAMMAEATESRSIVDAACGVATEYGENPLKGFKVWVDVAQGKPDGKGDFYRDCAFNPVTDSAPEETPTT